MTQTNPFRTIHHWFSTDQYTWQQEMYYDYDPEREGEICAMCSAGAVYFVLNRDMGYDSRLSREPKHEVLFEILAEVINSGDDNVNPEAKIVEWNDKPGRTKDEVLAAFARAADRWDAEHV